MIISYNFRVCIDSVKVYVVNKTGDRKVPDCCGFRIIVCGPDTSDYCGGGTKVSAMDENSEQLKVIKCLTSWSVYKKIGFSKSFVIKGESD